MGDVLSFIEKAELALDAKKTAELEKKLAKNKFDLNDLLDQFEQIERMGSIKDTIKMIPGIGKQIKDEDIDDKAFDKFRAIIYSAENPLRTSTSFWLSSSKCRKWLSSLAARAKADLK